MASHLPVRVCVGDEFCTALTATDPLHECSATVFNGLPKATSRGEIRRASHTHVRVEDLVDDEQVPVRPTE
jgi:hypothetical protein